MSIETTVRAGRPRPGGWVQSLTRDDLGRFLEDEGVSRHDRPERLEVVDETGRIRRCRPTAAAAADVVPM